ncbi:MAG: ThuA domain-containing protein [Prolixibacteraceae bacterium]|nr:ThuA domain-containing protein [Prolixibacteraceae bacterium]
MNRIQPILISLLFLLCSFTVSAKKLNILVITGGHGFDEKSFFEMFDSFHDISYTKLIQPEANTQLGTIDPKTYDAIVFYDMPKSITEQGKTNYYKLLKLGKGLVFLHHSQCSYQDWEGYKTIVGGKYHEEKNTPQTSTYQHDVTFTVKISDPKHPVTRGLKDFEILDEVYGNTEVLPGVTTLLTTDHPQSSKIIGWTHQIEKSRIVYIQPGHDKNSYINPDYQKLIFQAIKFVSGR